MRRIPSRARRFLAVSAIFMLAACSAPALQMNSAMNPLRQMGNPMPPGKVADLDFIRSEYQADQFEIALNRLASHQSPSKQIQDFARDTLRQLLPLDQNIYSAMSQLHIRGNKRLPRRYTRQLNRIGKLNGAAFDKAYLSTLLHAFRDEKNTYSDRLQTTTNSSLKPVLQQGLSYYINRLAALQKLALAHHLIHSGNY